MVTHSPCAAPAHDRRGGCSRQQPGPRFDNANPAGEEELHADPIDHPQDPTRSPGASAARRRRRTARRSSPTQQPRTSTATTISSAAGGHPGHHDFKVNLQARDQGPSTSPRIPAQPDVPTFRAPTRRGRGRYCTIGAKRAATRLVTVSVAHTRDACRSGGRPSLGPTSASPARTPVAPDRP